MKSTKRTAANTATDLEGQVIRLLATRLTSYGGNNSLEYAEVVRAFNEKDTRVNVQTGARRYGYNMLRMFGRLSPGQLKYESVSIRRAGRLGPVFLIGCHTFTLQMFNRILRAAGIRTTKPTTLKRIAAVV